MLLANALMRLPQLGANSLPLAAGAFATGVAFAANPAVASALFQAADLSQERFVLVAAPIGDGVRAQLNIYEQVKPTRPCFAVAPGSPAPVDPLLATFDFSGICSRFIDANGYSVRVGGARLAHPPLPGGDVPRRLDLAAGQSRGLWQLKRGWY